MARLIVSYYLAGYYLVQMDKNLPKIFTCSTCINKHLLGVWSYSWCSTTQNEIDEAQKRFNLSRTQFQNLQSWADEKFVNGSIGWANVFLNIEAALDYKERFFQKTENVFLLALYIGHDFRNDLLEFLKPSSTQVGKTGVYQCLEKSILEIQDPDEHLLGYDYIGIEVDGEFHSFHCHQLACELVEKFGLDLNGNGLFEDTWNQVQVEEFLNDTVTGCEAVPWGTAKVKLVKNGRCQV